MADPQEDCTILDSQRLSRLAKLPHREKSHRPIVDFVFLSSLVAAYIIHFAGYSREKTNVTQLVLENVWKLVYDQFLCEHPSSKFT